MAGAISHAKTPNTRPINLPPRIKGGEQVPVRKQVAGAKVQAWQSICEGVLGDFVVYPLGDGQGLSSPMITAVDGEAETGQH